MRAFALAIMIGCSGYFRPSELLTQQPEELVPPQVCVDPQLQHWSMHLCSSERDVPSKTLAFDESVTVDHLWMTWVAPLIAALQRQLQGHSISL